jgi:hypothetical protein
MDLIVSAGAASRLATRRSSRFRVAALGLAGLLLACGRDLATPPSSAVERNEAPPVPPAPSAATPLAKECAVMALERCFATSAEACAAIACPLAQCEFAYSMPMQATCR